VLKQAKIKTRRAINRRTLLKLGDGVNVPTLPVQPEKKEADQTEREIESHYDPLFLLPGPEVVHGLRLFRVQGSADLSADEIREAICAEFHLFEYEEKFVYFSTMEAASASVGKKFSTKTGNHFCLTRCREPRAGGLITCIKDVIQEIVRSERDNLIQIPGALYPYPFPFSFYSH